jgi:hypothetical protein
MKVATILMIHPWKSNIFAIEFMRIRKITIRICGEKHGAGACKVPCIHGHFGLMATLTITKKWWF